MTYSWLTLQKQVLQNGFYKPEVFPLNSDNRSAEKVYFGTFCVWFVNVCICAKFICEAKSSITFLPVSYRKCIKTVCASLGFPLQMLFNLQNKQIDKNTKECLVLRKNCSSDNKCLRCTSCLRITLVFLSCFISIKMCIFYTPVYPLQSCLCTCLYVCKCARVYFCPPWRCIIFSRPPFFCCGSSSDNQWCSSFSGLSCGPSSSDQGPGSAEDSPERRDHRSGPT